MGIDALSRGRDGLVTVPATDREWQGWVSATATRLFLLRNTLIDWFELHGDRAGFRRDSDLPGFDPRTEFSLFIMRKGSEFETTIARHLGSLASLLRLTSAPDEVRDPTAAEDTFRAMCDGQPIIHQGVLRDGAAMTYGAPDFLVRSDVFARLFPGHIGAGGAAVAAPDLPGLPWHYVVVDAKFTTLRFLAKGALGPGGSMPAYKAQMAVYNQALGRLQGFTPPTAFLLGRGWEQTRGGHKQRGTNAMERLGPVPMEPVLTAQVDAAAAWVRSVRTEGAAWSPLPSPSVPELWPNMGEQGDFPWHAAKTRVAQQLGDLTLLWQVGPDKRDGAHAHGVRDWRDPACTPAVAGVTGEFYVPRLHAILDVNRDSAGPPVRPPRVSAARDVWHPQPRLEFFVDFETVSDVNDDFAAIPERGGQPLIFLIGCGHVEDGAWAYREFLVQRLTEQHEATIIDAWLAHMHATAQRMGAAEPAPNVVHWSRAEPITLETAYNSAKARHPDKHWPPLRWFDLLVNVIRRQPVVVRGALNFSLKSFAKALHAHGLIQTAWEDGPLDGLGAMVGAWACEDEARARGVSLAQTDLMRQLVRYNGVDCRVLMETLRYLRERH